MLSCADAEQMELCPDEMKRKKQAFLNQNPCTRVFHIFKEERKKKRKNCENGGERKFLKAAVLDIG